MSVSVRFPGVPDPSNYREVKIEIAGGTKIFTSGSVVIEHYGAHVETNGEEYLFPWMSIRQMEFERES